MDLRQQRNTMRTRQSRAEAFSVAQTELDGGEIGQIFERWETRVAETEVASGCLIAAVSDSFDEEFLDSEEAASLKLELQALKEGKA